MLSFLKYVLATMVGFFLFLIVGVLILVGIASMFSNSDKEVSVDSNSVLKIDLNSSIQENVAEEDPFSQIFGSEVSKIGLNQLKKAIANAKVDPNIKGIYLHLEYPMAGYATLEDLREALLDFKKSNKFVYTYGEIMTEKAVYLSSIADKSYINTAGGIEFNGLDAEVTFLQGMFEKIGVKPVIFRVGEFKSAVEPFIRKDMSEASKEQMTSYTNSIANHIYGKISKDRNIPRTELDEILNKALIQTPADAVKYKILTNYGYFDEFETDLKAKIGIGQKEKISYISLNKYLKAPDLTKEGDRNNRIAVLVSEGEINSGEGTYGENIGSETFIKDLKRAREDKKIKAIVLRINSPGGSALASDVMWREIQLTRKVKPVIASMGDVAASGGYYMAMGCDTIVAQPTTITGSIGIFGMLFNTQELMNNKLGVTFDGIKTHQFADSPTLTREMTDAEKMMIQNSVNKGYENFTSKAAKGRHMGIDQLKAIAGGRVWTGEQGAKNGLVDVLGGLNTAIQIAAKKSKMSEGNYQVKYYPTPKSEIEQIIGKINGSSEDATLKSYFGILAPVIKTIKNLDKYEKIQARMPFELNIK
jgi:protease IV